MPRPPAAIARWKWIRRSLTRPRSAMPSKVAALMKWFRKVSFPSDAGVKGSIDMSAPVRVTVPCAAVSETHGRIGLGLAAVAFFGAWLLMPGVGITDAERIFALVGAHRGQVLASSVLQLFSAACYAPAAVSLVIARPALRIP